MSELYFGGVEGGATHSKLIICNKNGEIVSKVAGQGTNHWVIGIPEVARRINDMIMRAKQEANIDIATPIRALGLSLSGCEDEATNNELENELKKNHPNIAESYFICSDTIGSVFTASPLGGLVLIAGTGSNALLSNPDGKKFSCGGWGNFLADEGSAWWISHRAVKTVFDHMDNLHPSKFDISVVWGQIKAHFKIEKQNDLLSHCYANFDKAFYASLCASLARSADEGDPLSIDLFLEAGRYLAKSTLALLPRVDQQLLQNGDLNIICVGSVWKSWHLLEPGFSQEINTTEHTFGLNLLQLTEAMAIGATYIAADSIKFDLPRDYSKNYVIFHHYRKYASSKTNGTLENHSKINGIDKVQLNNGTNINGTTNGGSRTKCPSTIKV